MKVGVLAFQGDFAEHIQVLRLLTVDCCEVRTLAELSSVDHLIIPGGESTVMAKFLAESGVGDEVVRRAGSGLSVYGTCAGAILLAKHADGKNSPATLNLIDIDIERNAYGSQIDSFEAELTVRGIGNPVQASFIRAPKITRVGSDVEVLASHDRNPVLVRQRNIFAGTFHPEVRGNAAIHELFLRS